MRELVMAIGRTGCGKTFKLAAEVRRRLEQLHDAGVATVVLIHDTRLRVGQGWDPKAIGALAPEHARWKNIGELKDKGRDDKGRYLAHVNAFWECEPTELFGLANLRRRAGRATLVVVDELTMLPSQLQRSRPDHRAVHECLHFGRVGPVDVYATTQQPQRIDSAWLALATRVHLFSLAGDLQLDRIRRQGWHGADTIADRLPGLQPRQHFSLSPGG